MSESKRTIAAGEFKQTCLRVIDEVRSSGIRIVITKRGKPVAQIVPLEPEQQLHRWPTDMTERGSMEDDLIAPASEQASWEVLRD